MNFAPDIIFNIGSFPVTNILIHTLIIDGILIGACLVVKNSIEKPPNYFMLVIEAIHDYIYTLIASIASEKAKDRIFPYIMTFFLFIFTANFTGLLPGAGSIGIYNLHENSAKHGSEDHQDEHKAEKSQHISNFTALIRGATSDINTTLALAVISVTATHILSIQITGFNDYISRWISSNPVNLYVGLLELVAEFTKIISLSFRLFGNIYAGETAIHTISGIMAFVAPLPFILLESIVSIVQALVFSILTLVFMAVLTTPHHIHKEVIHK